MENFHLLPPYHSRNELVKVSASLEEGISFPIDSQTIFPLKLSKEQSGLSIQTRSMPENFNNIEFTMVIFQDNYDNLFKKLYLEKEQSQNLWVDDTFLTSLPANHEYIIEVYLEGRLLTAFQEYFEGNMVINKEIFIPDPAEIRFKVVNELGEPQQNATVNNWIYSATTDEMGFTEWIEVLPTINESYVAKATLTNEQVFWSEPFVVEDGERKVIQIIPENRK